MPIGSTRSGAGGTETAIEQQPEQGTVTDANMSDELSQKLSLMNTQISNLQTKVHDFDSTLTTSLDTLKTTVNDSVKALAKRVEKLETRVNNVEQTLTSRNITYDPLSDTDVTVVATGIPCDPGTVENLQAKVDKIMQVLDCDAKVVASKRLPGRDGRPGIVKISFENLNQKINVLKAKQKLRQHRTLHPIFLRSSQTHAERLVKLNFEMLLNEFPNCNLHVTSNGRLVYSESDNNDHYPGSSFGRGSSIGFTSRGRGDTFRGRGDTFRGRSRGPRGPRGRGYAYTGNLDMFDDDTVTNSSSETDPKISSLQEFPPINTNVPNTLTEQ